jgi:hypothetical protein
MDRFRSLMEEKLPLKLFGYHLQLQISISLSSSPYVRRRAQKCHHVAVDKVVSSQDIVFKVRNAVHSVKQ